MSRRLHRTTQAPGRIGQVFLRPDTTCVRVLSAIGDMAGVVAPICVGAVDREVYCTGKTIYSSKWFTDALNLRSEPQKERGLATAPRRFYFECELSQV